MTNIRFTDAAIGYFTLGFPNGFKSEVEGKLISIRNGLTMKGFNIGEVIIVGTRAQVDAGTADITQEIADSLKTLTFNGDPIVIDVV